MSATAHQSIVEAVAALYTAATALAGGRVFEGRDMPLGSDVASQIHVFLNDSPAEARIITGAPVDWESEIATVIRARKSGADSAEKVADALLYDAYSRVMADQTIGGRVQQLRLGVISRDRDQADPDVAAFTLTFTVVHRTASNTLAAA